MEDGLAVIVNDFNLVGLAATIQKIHDGSSRPCGKTGLRQIATDAYGDEQFENGGHRAYAVVSRGVIEPGL